MKRKYGIAALAVLFVCGILSTPAHALYYDPDDEYYDYHDYDSYSVGNDTVDDFYLFEESTQVTGKEIKKDAGTIRVRQGRNLDLNTSFIFSNNNEDDPIYPSSPKTWSSDRPEVAQVTKNGAVTANRAGVARVTVTYRDNRDNRVSQTLRIKVVEKSTNNEEYVFVVREGQNLRLSELLLSGLPAHSVSWSSDCVDILEVDRSGFVKPIRYGTGRISASATEKARA